MILNVKIPNFLTQSKKDFQKRMEMFGVEEVTKEIYSELNNFLKFLGFSYRSIGVTEKGFILYATYRNLLFVFNCSHRNKFYRIYASPSNFSADYKILYKEETNKKEKGPAEKKGDIRITFRSFKKYFQKQNYKFIGG